MVLKGGSGLSCEGLKSLPPGRGPESLRKIANKSIVAWDCRNGYECCCSRVVSVGESSSVSKSAWRLRPDAIRRVQQPNVFLVLRVEVLLSGYLW